MKKLLLALLLSGGAARADPVLVNGAGATFPFPLYSRWFFEFNKLHPETRFNYQSIGSGGGIQQLTAGTVDFGATDAPMNAEELGRVPDAVHIPTVLGAVALTYNAPVAGLRLTPALVEGVFLGGIRRWNDPSLAKVNPGIPLPDAAITVIHRSDGSGTTYVFTDYLAKISLRWKKQVGVGKSVSWPVGLGGKGNEGVTGLLRQTPGSIGYVELAYATQNKLPTAAIQNRSGRFVTPTIEATSRAAAGVELPADYRVSVTDAPGKDAWPIASFTYILVRRDARDRARGEALVKFLWWAVHEGQRFAAPLDYAPLPKAVVARVEATIRGLKVQGKAIPIASSR